MNTKHFTFLIFAILFFIAGIATVPKQASAYNWTQQIGSGQHDWRSMASDSTGMKLAAGDMGSGNGGYIYTSTDGGLTWTGQTASGIHTWLGIASDSTGTKLVAGDNNSLCACAGGYIYTSTNGGVTWTQQTGSGQHRWTAITSDATGTKLAAVETFGSVGYIYTSINSGVTWTQQTNAGQNSWYSITSDSTGTKLAAGTLGGYIYTSTNSGVTWTQQMASGWHYWTDIASDTTGMKLAATDNNNNTGGWGYIYTSTNGGVTWTAQTASGLRDWWSIASDSTGMRLVAGVLGGGFPYLYTSTNSGLTWTQEFTPGSSSWVAVTSDSTGNKLAAGSDHSYIWTTIVPTTPPSVSTVSSTGVTQTSATLNGALNATNGANATTDGFQYGPTTGYGFTLTQVGSFGVGPFTLNAAGLGCGITYHYRAYATNSAGTGYGADMTFTTNLCIVNPTVITTSAASVSGTSETLNGSITATGNANTTVRGFNYGLTTAYGSITTQTGSFGTGPFNTTITGLVCKTAYHFRAYATNSAGTSYGADMNFTTADCSIVVTPPPGGTGTSTTGAGTGTNATAVSSSSAKQCSLSVSLARQADSCTLTMKNADCSVTTGTGTYDADKGCMLEKSNTSFVSQLSSLISQFTPSASR